MEKLETWLDTCKRVNEIATARDLTDTDMFFILLLGKMGKITDLSCAELNSFRSNGEYNWQNGVYKATRGLVGISPKDVRAYSIRSNPQTSAAIKRLYDPLELAFQLDNENCERIRDGNKKLREIILTSEGKAVYDSALKTFQ